MSRKWMPSLIAIRLSGLRLTDVFDTLQIYFGSAYVNDINLFGKTYAVYAQADAKFRDQADDIACWVALARE